VSHRNGSKPAIQYGPPGRSAVTGHVATVFGCTGFLGRYLVSKLGVWVFLLFGFLVLMVYLAKAGTQVVVPYRDEDEKRFLKVMGDLGQIVPMVLCVSFLEVCVLLIFFM
jgi:NADH dehydrogenase (ubiquinone) 1 alpha subcomplex subunit 9